MTRAAYPRHLCGFGCDFVAALGFLAIQYVAMPGYALPAKKGQQWIYKLGELPRC